jgi:uncharacterized membrane protein required for colicin V production
MIIDVIIVLTVLLFVFLGFKNGFARTIFHTFGWILAIIAAALLRKPFENFLQAHTTQYDHIYAKTESLFISLADKMTDAATSAANISASSDPADIPAGVGSVRGVPGLLTEAIQDAPEKIATLAAGSATDVLFGIIAFLELLFVIKLVFYILTVLFSRKYHKKGIVGGLDGLAGAVLGLAQAGLLIFAVLALLLPVSYVTSPGIYDWVIHSMDRSIFSQYIYENNPLLYLLRDYVPADLLPTEWFA